MVIDARRRGKRTRRSVRQRAAGSICTWSRTGRTTAAESRCEVNAQEGAYENAAQAASYFGHKSVLKLLLDRGAEVNAQGGYYLTALQAACVGGHESIVRLLLDQGAHVHARGLYESALRAASYHGRKTIVTLLLDRGAEVDAQGGSYGTRGGISRRGK